MAARPTSASASSSTGAAAAEDEPSQRSWFSLTTLVIIMTCICILVASIILILNRYHLLDTPSSKAFFKSTSNTSLRSVWLHPVNPQDPPTLASSSTNNVTRRVLVAGGGLAGLSAALELAERGFQVTLWEASDVLGGRLATREVPIEFLNKSQDKCSETTISFAIEHGFHAWFANYHVFADIRRRLGINEYFRPWGDVQYVFKDKKKYKPEAIASKGPYPLNLMRIVLQSPNLSLLDAMWSIRSAFALMWFDHDKVWEQSDHLSFREWALANGVSQAFYDIIFAPSLSVTLNEKEGLSAAEMLMFSHLYFLSHPRADRREVTTTDYYTAVIGPWQRHLEKLGVVIELEKPVEGLLFSPDNVNVLTTAGTDVDPGASSSSFDYIVLATNLQGVHTILNASQATDDETTTTALHQLQQQVSHLEIAPPYKILRLFFDKALEGPYAEEVVLETPDAAPVNLIAQYHLLEEAPAKWAKETGGSVIECHLYSWEGTEKGAQKEEGEEEKKEEIEEEDISAEALWEHIRPTVCGFILPEMCQRNFSVVGGYVGHFHDFPSFKKGLHKYRPQSSTPREMGLSRLALAGDWLATLYPSALMERAVATGREAANVILLQERVRQVPMCVTSGEGPGVRVLW